jgi:hypothetical protein
MGTYDGDLALSTYGWALGTWHLLSGFPAFPTYYSSPNLLWPPGFPGFPGFAGFLGWRLLPPLATAFLAFPLVRPLLYLSTIPTVSLLTCFPTCCLLAVLLAACWLPKFLGRAYISATQNFEKLYADSWRQFKLVRAYYP